MKVLLAVFLVAIVGCGGSQAEGTSESNQAAPLSSQDNGSATGEEEAVPIDEETLRAALLGAWENASCGLRKYNRRIVFQEGGKFNAVDEIAPCPEGKECVLPGIIEWAGTWDMEDKDISIEPAKSQNQRLPETIPESFVILNEDPISTGEKTGTLVCPYTKVQ